MKLSRQAKYSAANVALGVLIFFAVKLMGTQPGRVGGLHNYLLLAIGLYIAGSVAITMRAYWRSMRNSTLDQSQAAAELGVHGFLGADRLKTIEFNLDVSQAEFNQLRGGQLVLAPERFGRPLRQGDRVIVRRQTAEATQQLIAVIARVDGVNQQVVLQLSS